MLNPDFIRENREVVENSLKKRGFKTDLDLILKLDEKRRTLAQKVDELRARRNLLAKEGKKTDEAVRLKGELKKIEPEFGKVEEELHQALWNLPNLVHPETPVGKSEADNVEVSRWGEPTKFDFAPLDHVELGRKLDLIDFESGAKVAGSDWYFLRNEAVILELALTRFALDFLQKEGFVAVLTPDVSHLGIIDGIGFQPAGPESQVYEIKDTDLGLIATAEITIGGLHAEEILEEESLPLRYVGLSHCFRRESGAYGQYSRGLYRVHQFTKVEMFIFCRPEESEEMHTQLLAHEEAIWRELEIPYRVMEMCSGDLGAAAYRKFDLEAWMPGRGDYGEVTSTSNTTDYQARRLNIRYKTQGGENRFVYTLNGTAIAMSRILIAILENFQQKDGSVTVPKVLRSYTGFEKISPK